VGQDRVLTLALYDTCGEGGFVYGMVWYGITEVRRSKTRLTICSLPQIWFVMGELYKHYNMLSRQGMSTSSKNISSRKRNL